jgi:hypothetical protein
MAPNTPCSTQPLGNIAVIDHTELTGTGGTSPLPHVKTQGRSLTVRYHKVIKKNTWHSTLLQRTRPGSPKKQTNGTHRKNNWMDSVPDAVAKKQQGTWQWHYGPDVH